MTGSATRKHAILEAAVVRRAEKQEPAVLLNGNPLVRIKGKNGLWFVFEKGTTLAEVKHVAFALKAHGIGMCDSEDGVVKLPSAGAEVYLAVSVDPSNDVIQGIARAKVHDNEGQFKHAHIGGDNLPALDAKDAATRIFQLFHGQRKRAAADVAAG